MCFIEDVGAGLMIAELKDGQQSLRILLQVDEGHVLIPRDDDDDDDGRRGWLDHPETTDHIGTNFILALSAGEAILKNLSL